MSEQNGNAKHISTALQEVRDAVAQHDDSVLLDMRDQYGGLRQFLVGSIREDGVWPSGNLRIEFDGSELRMSLSIYSLDIVREYRGDSFSGLLELINTDLEENTVKWKLSYSGQERRKKRLLAGT